MKKIPLLLLTVFLFLSVAVTAQNQSTKTTTQNVSKTTASASPLNGAWQSEDKKTFAIMHDGFFSDVSQDSTGIWRETHAGTYTMEGDNAFTMKVLYSSFPDRIGALHTVEYKVEGDNLTMTWFKKLIMPNGEDITAQMPKGEQTKLVRAKQ